MIFLRYSYSITVLRNGIFWVASQEIICNSGRQQTKSLTKILDENALEYLASGKNFNGDRLTARNLNENLENNLQLEFFPCLPCVPWIFLVAYGKKSLEEIFNKNMAYGQKYIIGIYAETKISNL